jgi:hypothetical protein
MRVLALCRFTVTKKAERREGMSFGSPAISMVKIRGFPPPSRERLGFIGKYVYVAGLIVIILSSSGRRTTGDYIINC